MPQPPAEASCPKLAPQVGKTIYLATLGECVPNTWHSGIPLFSPDKKWVALVEDARVRIWDIASRALVREIQNPYSKTCEVSKAVFSPDARYLAASYPYCAKSEKAGHVLVWDAASGDLLQDWSQVYASMPPTSADAPQNAIPISALAFSPDSATLIFASGNTIEIRDVVQKDRQDVIRLGPKMFASQLSLSPDGRFVYIVMDWLKTQSTWVDKFNLQIWNLKDHTLVREIKYPEGFEITKLDLQGKYLVYSDLEKKTTQVTDLETGKTWNILPLLLEGERHYSTGARLAVFTRVNVKETALELWDNGNRRNVLTYQPRVEMAPIDIAFGADGTLLAIARIGQVTLWNIGPLVYSK